jgi:general secretion pathway protein D
MNGGIFAALLGPVPYGARTGGRVAGALVWALATAASAQIDLHAAPKPAALSTLTATTARASEADLLVTFASNAAKYSIAGNGGRQITLSFFRTTMDPRIAPPAIGNGLLSSIRITREDDLLMLTLTAAAPIRLESSDVGGSALNLRIVPARAKVADVGVVRRDLPRFRDRDASEDGFEVVRLKYADVSEIAGMLSAGSPVRSNDRFAPHAPQFGAAIASNGAGGAASYGPVLTTPPPADAGREPLAQAVDDSLAIDRRLNAVVLRGSRERIERLKRQIALLDVPLGSVILETGFFELDRSGARNLGLSFGEPGSQVAVASLETGAFNSFSSPGVAASASLQAALSAQIGAGHGRVVVAPRIAALDGSSARLETGEALPILTSIALQGLNAASPQVRYVSVGVTLEIAPRVSADGRITSHVFCVMSNVTGSSMGYPTVGQREVSTSVTVRDGEPFVVGGLTQLSDLASSMQPPAPAGQALVRTSSSAQTELYVVVTPHIVKAAGSAGRAAF